MNNQAEITRLTTELSKYNTSHLAHLILTMMTGAWVIVWLLVAEDNAISRAETRNELGTLQGPEFEPEDVPGRVFGVANILQLNPLILNN